ncbi:MAG: thioredoxin family protein [Candidatus Methylacidiphilales bacterium]|nr:thioredoxin family protein [Candidatus Methylacidiphilales bacterium]
MNTSSLLMRFAFTAMLITLPQLSMAAEVGKPAPGFTLTDTQGKSHNLSDFKGKTVVLEWINHGCPFVVKHYSGGSMQALQKDTTSKGVVWLSICSSAPGKQGHLSPTDWNKTTSEKGAAPTAVLLDEDGKVGRLYQARTTPHMFVIDPAGKLVYAGAIDSIKSTDSADVPKATNHVKAAVEEVLAGKPVTTASTQAYGCSVKYAN